MTQRFSFWEDLTIRENLDFIARMYGMKDARPKVDEALAHLGLTPRADQLAGGRFVQQQQLRVMQQARGQRQPLFPSARQRPGEDPKARRDFWGELHALAAKGI